MKTVENIGKTLGLLLVWMAFGMIATLCVEVLMKYLGIPSDDRITRGIYLASALVVMMDLHRRFPHRRP